MNSVVRKVKLLFVINDMEIGGIQKSLIALLRYVSKQNLYEIDLMIWQKDGSLQKEVPDDVNLIFQDYPVTLSIINKEKKWLKKGYKLYQYFRFNWYFKLFNKPCGYYKPLIKNYDIAISYSHKGFPYFFVIDKVVASQKLLWYHHGSYHATDKEKKIDLKYFGLYDKISAVSSSNKILLEKNFPELQLKLQVVPNLIDAFDIKKRAEETCLEIQRSDKEFIFVTVSRFSVEKGIDLAINIASVLKEKGVKFKWYFVGDGELLQTIQKEVINKGLSDVCILIGKKNNPYPYVKQADLYIQTSYVEAHPITINEALVLKKLIVTTDLPATREVLQNGKLGILAMPDISAFVDAIFDILNNKNKRELFIKELTAHNVNNNTAHRIINQLFQI